MTHISKLLPVLVAALLIALAAPAVTAQEVVPQTTADAETTTVAPGETVEIAYTLSNEGNATASGGGIQLDLPSGVSVSDIQGPGTGSPDRFFVSPVGPNESVTVTYTFTVNDSVATNTTLDLGATGTLGEQTDRVNTSITVQESAPEPDLSVDAPTMTAQGNSFQVTYEISNTGDAVADSTGLNLTLPANVTISDVSGDGAGEESRFFVDPIAPGESASVTYTLDVASDASLGNVTITADANMSGETSATSSTSTTTVQIKETVDPVEAVAGPDEDLSFTETLDAISSFNRKEPVNGVELSFTDMIDIISSFNSKSA